MGLVTALFLLFITRARAQHGSSEVVGAVGGEVYLSPSPPNQVRYYQVHWWRDTTVKIATRDSRGNIRYANNTYNGRLDLFSNNTLKISRLQTSDTSRYKVHLRDEAGKETIERFLLTVYDLVPKPTVNAKVIRGDSTRCKAILRCSVGLKGVTYKWSSTSKFVSESANASKQQVSFDPSTEIHTCEVSNPVSSNTASLIYRHPCSWTGEESNSASSTTTLVDLRLLLLLLLLLALA
ncbi:CD48 antigen-like [Phoenicopterus ruber ruber]